MVMNQTIYMPKEQEEKQCKTVDSVIAAAKHIQAAPPRQTDGFDSSKWPEEGENADMHDPDIVDRV